MLDRRAPSLAGPGQGHVAAIAGDDDLLVGPESEATENCLGCGRSMPADSEYAFCARCE